MLYAALKFIHLLGIVVWIGGMFFTLFFLRPALPTLEVPVRLRLMQAVLSRFLNAVLVIVGLVLASGLGMIGHTARLGNFSMPLGWTLMASLGIVMIAIFLYIRFVLYRRLCAAVDTSQWPAGGEALAAIRRWVGINLAIGVAILLLTVSGL